MATPSTSRIRTRTLAPRPLAPSNRDLAFPAPDTLASHSRTRPRLPYNNQLFLGVQPATLGACTYFAQTAPRSIQASFKQFTSSILWCYVNRNNSILTAH